MKTLLAASGGGHLTQLFNLRSRLPFELGDVTWLTFDTPQSRSMLDGEDVVYAAYAAPRDLKATVRNAQVAFNLCRARRFDVAVSTGASVAVSALPVARLFGAKSYYIESSARVEGPSISGRLMAWTPGVRTSCQYRSWANGRWGYAGSVFDAFESGEPRPVKRIEHAVLTLGSQAGYPFERLVERTMHVLPDDTDVLWQTGATDVTDLGIPGVVSMPGDQLQAAVVAADVVIAHAGVGSALSALRAGRHPVLVARRQVAGEHVDDHQLQIAAELSQRGLATACSVEDLDLDVLLDAARRTVVTRTSVPPLSL